MEEFRDASRLAEAVRSQVRGRTGPLIGVDGGYGAGKSTLSKSLMEELGGVRLELDCYTLKNGQPYRQQLKYEEIDGDLTRLREQGKPVIVDGICLIDVMGLIGITLDTLIYVKKVDERGKWPDEDTCDPNQIDLDSPLLKHPGAGVPREVAAYHLARDPLSEADFLFVRVDTS